MQHLEKEYDFFRREYTHLLANHLEKYLVIANEALQGSFDKELDAYIFGVNSFGSGNFIIKFCSNQVPMAQTFSNRIIF